MVLLEPKTKIIPVTILTLSMHCKPLLASFLTLLFACSKNEKPDVAQTPAIDNAQVSIFGGNNQVGQQNNNLANPLVVLIKEVNGVALPGVTVTWSVITGNGQLAATTSTTGSNGQASNTWKLGTSGDQTVTAAIRKSDGTDVSGSPITFTASFRTPGELSLVFGDNQTGQPNTNLPSPLAVAVEDASGQLISGVSVSWTILAGGGQISAGTSTTDDSGQTSIVWKLGTSGTQTLNAILKKADGSHIHGSPRTFTATLRPLCTNITVAGGNGSGSSANQFTHPWGLFVDAAGNFYVVDRANHRVQKWAPGASSGVTVAGGNGPGTGANQLTHPWDVVVDASGNVYVSDGGNHRIQKWTQGAAAGVTVANAEDPIGLYLDASNNLYIVESSNDRVQKWAPGATAGITVAGGNGQGLAADQLYNPHGVSVDAAGNVYVADTYNHRIQKWAPGAVTGVTVAGGNGIGSNANQFYQPYNTFLDAVGNIYVADGVSSRIQKWAPEATEGVTVAGIGGAGFGPCQLSGPSDLFVDAAGYIYVTEYTNHRVQKWTPL